jgi:hypothetical protein
MAPVLTSQPHPRRLPVAILGKLQPDTLQGRTGNHTEYQAFMGITLNVHKTLKPKNTVEGYIAEKINVMSKTTGYILINHKIKK